MTRSGEISRLRPITVPEKDDITVEGESIREASKAIDEARADHSASDIEQIRNGQILFRKQADFIVPRNSHGKQDVLPVPDFCLAAPVRFAAFPGFGKNTVPAVHFLEGVVAAAEGREGQNV